MCGRAAITQILVPPHLSSITSSPVSCGTFGTHPDFASICFFHSGKKKGNNPSPGTDMMNIESGGERRRGERGREGTVRGKGNKEEGG